MIILLACAAFALMQARAQVTIGAKAGLNLSTISNVELMRLTEEGGQLRAVSLDPKYLLGAHAGGYARYDFTPVLGAQAELLYSMVGYKLEMPVVSYNGATLVDTEINTRLHYLTLPLLLRATLPGTGLFAELGPQMGIRLGERANYDFTAGWLKGHFSDKSHQATDLDLSGVVGLGYRMRCGLSLSARYVHEFKTSDKRFIPGLSRKRAFQLSLAYDIKTF